MKNYFANFILVSSVFLLFFSCKEAPKEISSEELVQEIIETETQLSDKNSEKALSQEEKIAFWKNELEKEKYFSNRVAKARINYLLGKNFAPLNIDSSEVYVTKALILIEDIEGFENEKTVIYNGLGNIAQAKGKIFLSSFYYNKIVSILDATPSISTISATNRVQFYLHSAQSNTRIGLHESAYELNRKAENYVDSLSEDDFLRFRIYNQLFNSGYKKEITKDSLRYYLEKVAQHSYSDQTNLSYYNNKAQFFSLNQNYDSAKIYLQEVIQHRLSELESNNTSVSIYTDYCNILQNSILRKRIDETSGTLIKIRELEQQFSDYLTLPDRLLFEETMMYYYYEVKNLDAYHETTKTVVDLKDQIQKEAELQAKQEMHTMYQLEENKKSIKKLNQNVEVTESQLQKTKFFLVITVLVILVIIALLVILYYRQKSQKLQQEYEKVVLEQKLLRTQMEPHFIFNTLSTLQSLIRFQEPRQAIDYLNLFSRLLRSNLELSRQDIISLEDEIESLHNYLKLQQARFKDYFTYQIQIPTNLEIDALFIPPMLIQPFVENSILHGFNGEREWNIEIKITELAQTNQLQIEIIDNGIGINPTLKKKKKSISGDIAKERLEILAKKYKVPTDYQIFSEKGKGTKVVIKLPIIDGFKQD